MGTDTSVQVEQRTHWHMGPAISNPRHRRSLSQGDMWLDHRPNQIQTVLQLSLKTQRSVTCVKSGDLLGDKVTNYCLTTQEQDSAGELETKLYKGDVLPTVGGGAQVVFQDVDVLKLSDPTEVTTGVTRDFDGRPITDLNTIQDRCGVAIHGHRGRGARSSKEN
ncbi:kinesin-like protein KIF23 [Oratosquilla oratoria]|uniref:kinesin-like protein KIF23 n=1 Tax=Oratosquilla oratoria TaxID=337810 RepID=UPI003F7677ED